MQAPAARDLLVVVLHYGNPEMTARLHRQLLQSDQDWQGRLLVLDNHAPAPYPQATLRSEENLYWGGALAFCAALARSRGASHLWFLNNDLVFVSPGPHIARAWGRLRRLEKTVGPVAVYSPACTANPYHPQMVAAAGMQYRLVHFVDGVAPLVNLERLEATGGVDLADNPYGYGVETVLSLQTGGQGWRVVVDHQVQVRHRYHTTAKEQPGFMDAAAAAHDAYLARRLGPDFRQRIQALGQDFTDVESL